MKEDFGRKTYVVFEKEYFESETLCGSSAGISALYRHNIDSMDIFVCLNSFSNMYGTLGTDFSQPVHTSNILAVKAVKAVKGPVVIFFFRSFSAFGACCARDCGVLPQESSGAYNRRQEEMVVTTQHMEGLKAKAQDLYG